MAIKKDIEEKTDIERLVNTFYEKVRMNQILGPIFNEVVKVQWENHLPKMYEFWGAILLGGVQFKGNPMRTHILLSQKTEIGKLQFDTWLQIWKSTVDELFAGPLAEDAKTRAESIAGLMLLKIETYLKYENPSKAY